MLIDISYPISEEMAFYPHNPRFKINMAQSIRHGDSANVSEIYIGAHTGTHIDAPLHFLEGGKGVGDIPLERMNGVAKVVDATGRPEIDLMTVKTIEISAGDIVLFKTDNSMKWSCDSVLEEYTTLSYEAAEYLAEKKVNLVGIDYLTIEKPRKNREEGKSIHKTLLGNDVLICEALKLNAVTSGAYLFHCLPLNIKTLDGCPTRCVLREV